MRIHCLQHVAHEGPGTLREWAALHGYHINFTMLFEADPTWPDESEFDLLLVMGGFMNVDEEQKFPWLKKEKEFIKESLQNDKQVVGICLGAQLLASALGKPVYPGSEKEIGFCSNLSVLSLAWLHFRSSVRRTVNRFYRSLQKPGVCN